MLNQTLVVTKDSEGYSKTPGVDVITPSSNWGCNAVWSYNPETYVTTDVYTHPGVYMPLWFTDWYTTTDMRQLAINHKVKYPVVASVQKVTNMGTINEVVTEERWEYTPFYLISNSNQSASNCHLSNNNFVQLPLKSGALELKALAINYHTNDSTGGWTANTLLCAKQEIDNNSFRISVNMAYDHTSANVIISRYIDETQLWKLDIPLEDELPLTHLGVVLVPYTKKATSASTNTEGTLISVVGTKWVIEDGTSKEEPFVIPNVNSAITPFWNLPQAIVKDGWYMKSLDSTITGCYQNPVYIRTLKL